MARGAFSKLLNLVRVISYPDLVGFWVDSFASTIGYEQNNSSAGAPRFLAHFSDVHCTTTKLKPLNVSFKDDVDIQEQIFLSLFEHG